MEKHGYRGQEMVFVPKERPGHSEDVNMNVRSLFGLFSLNHPTLRFVGPSTECHPWLKEQSNRMRHAKIVGPLNLK